MDQKLSLSFPIIIGTIPLLSGIVTKIKNIKNAKNEAPTINGDAIETAQDNNESIVQVTVTDEAGNVVEENDQLGEELEALLSSRKRVRMPSSILSELYPSLPSPYYR